jgi:WD40 repeat protein
MTMNHLSPARPPSNATLNIASKPLSLKGHTQEIGALAFTRDGKTLATASNDGTVRLWDVATGIERFTLEARMAFIPGDHRQGQQQMAFSPDGKLLATRWMTRTERGVKLWDVATGKGFAILRQEDIGGQLAFSPNGNRLASAEDIGGVKLWDTGTHRELGTVNNKRLSDYELTSLVFSPDGKTLATGGYLMRRPFFTTRGELKLWDAATAKQSTRLQGQYGRVYCVTFSPDGKMVAAGMESGTPHVTPHYGEVKIWDAASGRLLKTLKGENRRNIEMAVAFSPRGDTLATASEGSERQLSDKYPATSEVLLWDVATWKVREVLRGDQGEVTSLAFTPDGRALVTSDGYDLRLWNVTTAKERAVLKVPTSGIDLFALSPDGKQLAAACSEFSYKDGTVRVWNVAKLLEQKVEK